MENEIYYLRRKNLGNYEHTEASVRFTVNGLADVDHAFAVAKSHVEKALQINSVQSSNPAPAAERQSKDYLAPPLSEAPSSMSAPGVASTPAPGTLASPPLAAEPTTGLGAINRVRKAAQAPVTIGAKTEAAEANHGFIVTAEDLGHKMQAKIKALAAVHTQDKACDVVRALVKKYTATDSNPQGGQYYNIAPEQRGAFLGELDYLK